MKNFWNYHHANFKLRFTNNLILFLCLFLLFVSQSCKKEQNAIGLDLPGGRLGTAFSDTTTLSACSVLEDTLNTKNLIFNYLGYLKDDVFGTTTANIYTQFVPQASSFNPGNAPTLDSIVLTLRYSGNFYGDTLNPFIIKVYELSEDISSDQTYYQNSSLAHKGENLTADPSFLLYPKPNTKVKLDTLKEAHVRIRLKDNLGNTFLNNPSQLQDDATLKKFFKGLYICVEPFQNNGSMVNFSLTNSLSGIQIYYKDGSNKRQFSLIVNQNATRFSSYQHNYESGNANFKQQVIQKDTSKGKEMLYVQSMGGIKTKITFPYLKTLKNKNIVINKAELVITNIGENSEWYPAPNRLTIQAVNKQEKIIFLPDDAIYTSDAYWGGTIKNNEYRFRITKYIQDIILRDNLQPYIYLVTNRAAADANRLVLKGTDTVLDARLRLELYYTEY